MEEGALELELVGRAAAGDEDAFRTLVDRHGRMVFNVAYRITGERTRAEGVVQETFPHASRAPVLPAPPPPRPGGPPRGPLTHEHDGSAPAPQRDAPPPRGRLRNRSGR